MQSLGTRLNYTEQYCMSNIIATHLVSSTVIPCMHTSQRVKEYHKNTHGNWQLSLRVEKKPLSYPTIMIVSGGFIQPCMHWRLTDVHTVQHTTFYLYVKSGSGKVNKLRIGKWRQNWRTKCFWWNPHKSCIWNTIRRNLTTSQIGLTNEVCSS